MELEPLRYLNGTANVETPSSTIATEKREVLLHEDNSIFVHRHRVNKTSGRENRGIENSLVTCVTMLNMLSMPKMKYSIIE